VSIRDALDAAKKGTISYPPEAAIRFAAGTHETVFEVTNEGTLEAARRLASKNPVALNFASAKHPGGGFLGGAIAQEESIARSSGLYACIEGDRMYAHHAKHRDPMYTAWAIYSPAVPVIRDTAGALLEEPHLSGFITSPAPNARVVLERTPERKPNIATELAIRVERVLAIAQMHAHDHLVLGAWGCGVFGNDPAVVAEAFDVALRGKFRGAFVHVVFAILGEGANLAAFRGRFS
jgi:uncharacterized protein (TIGR02452 family)